MVGALLSPWGRQCDGAISSKELLVQRLHGLSRGVRSKHGVRRVAILSAFAEPEPEVQNWFAAFVQQLRDLGWIEGANIQIDTGRLMSAASTEPRWS